METIKITKGDWGVTEQKNKNGLLLQVSKMDLR